MSPYFKTLLASGFAESFSVPSKRARRTWDKPLSTADELGDEDVQDSDDDTDELYIEKHPPQPQTADDEAKGAYKEIKITKTAFSTYRAGLAYLRTGHIAFAPLSSSDPIDKDTSKSFRRECIEDAVDDDPTLPYPVSPKSTYRLAHLLELPRLQSQCLAELEERLTVYSAPHELFDGASVCYDAWRRIIITFVAEHWRDVKGSSNWLEVEGKVARNELPSSGLIMLELMKAREEARGAFLFSAIPRLDAARANVWMLDSLNWLARWTGFPAQGAEQGERVYTLHFSLLAAASFACQGKSSEAYLASHAEAVSTSRERLLGQLRVENERINVAHSTVLDPPSRLNDDTPSICSTGRTSTTLTKPCEPHFVQRAARLVGVVPLRSPRTSPPRDARSLL